MNANGLLQTDVIVVYSRTIEDAAFCISLLPQQLLRKERRVESRPSIAPIRVDVEWPWQITRWIDQEVIHTIAQSSQVRVGKFIGKSDGKTPCEAACPREAPIRCPAIGVAEEPFETEIHTVPC